MRNQSSIITPSTPRRLRRARFIPALVLLISIHPAHAGSATWKSNPGSGDWNTAANWTPQTVPNQPSDTATFASSVVTNVSNSSFFEIDGIAFNPGASAFTITTNNVLQMGGAGITNNSGGTQNFVVNSGAAAIQFFGAAAAGISTIYTNTLGEIDFFDTSTAGGAASFSNIDGVTEFFAASTSGSATFSNIFSSTIQYFDGASAGTASLSNNAEVLFWQTAAAGASTITNNADNGSGNGTGRCEFMDTSTAGNATLIANASTNGGNGASISFAGDSSGGTSRIELFGNGAGAVTDGTLDIAGRTTPEVTVGSLEGNGLVLLGANNLTIGSNSLSTTFSGIVQGAGSITKTGNGKLTFSGANTYSGGTTINAGTLFVTNRRGSGAGSGRVQINGGKLGGTAKISGNVIVGDGSGPEAFLTPGTTNAVPATLMIQRKLTFRADGTDHFGYRSSTATADKVVARGVTIKSGALLFFGPIDSGALTFGTVFTAIDNTAATPIAGTFANIADGATVTVGSNTFQANYEGGDGNDLTLTVVP